MQSNTLTQKQRRKFNVDSKEDIDYYRKFLMERKWGQEGCPFLLEDPWTSVPSMIETKLVYHFLGIKG